MLRDVYYLREIRIRYWEIYYKIKFILILGDEFLEEIKVFFYLTVR